MFISTLSTHFKSYLFSIAFYSNSSFVFLTCNFNFRFLNTLIQQSLMVNKYDQMQAGGVPSHQYLFSMAPKTLPIVTKLPPILVGLYVFCFFSVSFKKVFEIVYSFFFTSFYYFFLSNFGCCHHFKSMFSVYVILKDQLLTCMYKNCYVMLA